MKDQKINVPTKQRILIAAREVFSEKGYDGATTAEIAKKADVNKALLSYYFSGKENILKEVVRLGATDVLERREIILERSDSSDIESIKDYYEQMLGIMESRKEIVRIVMIESLKGSDAETPLFQFMEPFLKSIISMLNNKGNTIDHEQVETTEIFFDAIPLFMFVSLKEKWAKYKNIDMEKLEEDFMSSFKEIFISYLQNKYFGKKD